MSKKVKIALSAVALALALPNIASAATIGTIQVYNNLYNQAATSAAAGLTSSSVTVNYYNGSTKCDSAVVGYKSLVTEVVGTGSSQKCASVSSVQIVAGTSTSSSTLQVYSATPVTITLTTADYEHSIIIQNDSVGGTDNSSDPVFDTTNGSVTTAGVAGYILTESLIK